MAKLLLAEGAAPDTPASGKIAVYAKTDGKLYWKDDAGTEYPIQEVLTADRTYYINSTTGSDTNDGLTSGTAFETLSFAAAVASKLNTAGYSVIFQLADGTYPPTWLSKSIAGGGDIIVQGNPDNHEAVVFNQIASTNYGNAALVFDNITNRVTVRCMKFAVAGMAIVAGEGVVVWVEDLVFDSCSICLFAFLASFRSVDTTLTFRGTFGNVFYILAQSVLNLKLSTLVLEPGVAFGTFANCIDQSYLRLLTCTITGTGTGKKYNVNLNSVVKMQSTIIPGTIDGTAETGGQYI
jgi:hypothetical protein